MFLVFLKLGFGAPHSSPKKKRKIDSFRVSVSVPRMNHFHGKATTLLFQQVAEKSSYKTLQNSKKNGGFEAIAEDKNRQQNFPMASSSATVNGLLFALCKSASFQWRLLAFFTNQDNSARVIFTHRNALPPTQKPPLIFCSPTFAVFVGLSYAAYDIRKSSASTRFSVSSHDGKSPAKSQ